MKEILLVAGARPNFMKLAPLVRALEPLHGQLGFKIVHTGQHYDREMSDVFFEELGIPTPHFHLGAGGGSHAEQTAKIMVAFEALCQPEKPTAVVVFGDVNSTLACSIVAKKLGIKVAHVEAGLRSGDWAMPEEVNRVVTDSITDWYFVTEPSGMEHLRREGKPEAALHFVGHVMVDNVLFQRDKLLQQALTSGPSVDFKTRHPRYAVVTMHRPSNVDEASTLTEIASALMDISKQLPIAFPVHPRTRKNFEAFWIELGPHIELLPPLPYMEFLNLWKDAALVLTDSGGLQEETTALGVPCVTLRENTERPITVDEGSNVLAGTSAKRIKQLAQEFIEGRTKKAQRPQLWDGQAAQRIAAILLRELSHLG